MPLNFTYVDVKSEIVSVLKPIFEPLKIAVFKSDPLKHEHIPAIGVNRAGMDETSQVLGDDIGTAFDEDLQKWVRYKGTFFNETIEIRLWHTNADERDKQFILLMAHLFDMRDALAEKGLRNIVIRGGRDEQDNNYPPHPLFWGTVTMNYLNPLDVAIEIVDETIATLEVVQTGG